MCVQIEQFHTVVKGLARGPRNTMASIRNNYLLLVSSNFTRLAAPIDWVIEAKRSTAAGFMARAPSADKKDLFVEPKGKGRPRTLKARDLRQLQEVWGRSVPAYGLFRARFAESNARLPRRLRLRAISDWTSTERIVLTAQEKTWQQMDGKIEVRNLILPRFLCVMLTSTHAHTQSLLTHVHARLFNVRRTINVRRTM